MSVIGFTFPYAAVNSRSESLHFSAAGKAFPISQDNEKVPFSKSAELGIAVEDLLNDIYAQGINWSKTRQDGKTQRSWIAGHIQEAVCLLRYKDDYYKWLYGAKKIAESHIATSYAVAEHDLKKYFDLSDFESNQVIPLSQLKQGIGNLLTAITDKLKTFYPELGKNPALIAKQRELLKNNIKNRNPLANDYNPWGDAGRFYDLEILERMLASKKNLETILNRL